MATVTVWALLLFRKATRDRLANLRSVTGRGWEARFEADTAALEQAATTQLPQSLVRMGTAQSASPQLSEAWRLAAISPRAAVLEAWIAVEHALARAAESLALGWGRDDADDPRTGPVREPWAADSRDYS